MIKYAVRQLTLCQQLEGYEWARSQVVKRGAKVVYPVKLPSMQDLRYEGKSVNHSVTCEYCKLIPLTSH